MFSCQEGEDASDEEDRVQDVQSEHENDAKQARQQGRHVVTPLISSNLCQTEGFATEVHEYCTAAHLQEHRVTAGSLQELARIPLFAAKIKCYVQFWQD